MFDIKLHNNSEFFHRAIPYKREQREFIKAEMKSWTDKGIVEPISGVKCASSVVLVSQGQSGQDYCLCVNVTDLIARTQL